MHLYQRVSWSLIFSSQVQSAQPPEQQAADCLHATSLTRETQTSQRQHSTQEQPHPHHAAIKWVVASTPCSYMPA